MVRDTLIYGAGQGGIHLYQEIMTNEEGYHVVAFVDKMRCGGINNISIISPSEINKIPYDVILVATDDETVKDYLVSEVGVGEDKINVERYRNSAALSVRIRALKNFSMICSHNKIKGSAAEVGMYRGDFAKHINRLFSDRTLYLYDTFEGFHEEDICRERSDSAMRKYTHYSATAEDIVLQKMSVPQNVVIRKGFFPDTAVGEEDTYCFVNLDTDLYAPILAGLKYFYPKMSPGGAIFVHDYFNPGCPGVKDAVSEFCTETGAGIVPLGDYLTVCIVKPYK